MTKDEFLSAMDPRPKYDTQYDSVFNLFADMEKNQMFLAAFMLGIHLGQYTPITRGNNTRDILPLNLWRNKEQRDVIFYLLLKRSSKWSIPLNWKEIEDADETLFAAFKQEFNKMMNGYANTGFEFIKQKNQEDPTYFKQPFALIDLLVKVAKDSSQGQ